MAEQGGSQGSRASGAENPEGSSASLPKGTRGAPTRRALQDHDDPPLLEKLNLLGFVSTKNSISRNDHWTPLMLPSGCFTRPVPRVSPKGSSPTSMPLPCLFSLLPPPRMGTRVLLLPCHRNNKKT
jgi:hypothetical protein